jgi:hypothetical protein
MTAVWNVGGVPIYVSDESSTREIKRAELFPLDATSSTLQFFGAGSRHYSIKGLVTSGSHFIDLENYAITNATVQFVTPWDTFASAKISKEVKGTTLKYSGGTIDGITLKADVDKVIEVELELIIP